MNATATRPTLARFAAFVTAGWFAMSLALSLITLPMGAGLPGILSGTGTWLVGLTPVAIAAVVVEATRRHGRPWRATPRSAR
jgi:hypothetical protein